MSTDHEAALAAILLALDYGGDYMPTQNVTKAGRDAAHALVGLLQQAEQRAARWEATALAAEEANLASKVELEKAEAVLAIGGEALYERWQDAVARAERAEQSGDDWHHRAEELREEFERAEREADHQLGEKLAAQITLKAITDSLCLPLVSLGNGWTEATPKILARIEEIVDQANRDLARAERAEQEREQAEHRAKELVEHLDTARDERDEREAGAQWQYEMGKGWKERAEKAEKALGEAQRER